MQPWEDPELDEIRERHVRFAEEHLGGDALARDRAGEFSRDRWKACAEFGVLGTCMAKEFGGQARPVTHAVAALEGLGYGCRDGGFVYALCSQLFGLQMPLQLLATDELKRRYLPRLVAGEILAAHAFSETEAGSDALSITTTATADGEQFLLRGRKCFITNAPQADVALVFAKTSPGRSVLGLTAFLVDLQWEGASHGREFEKLGVRTVHMGELIFDDVRVPAGHVVGGKGGGIRVVGESTGWERAVLLTAALGPMSRCVDDCIAHAKTRRQFGKPIGAHQQVSSKIADMIVRLRTCRLVVYDMASRLQNGKSVQSMAQDAAIAKLFVSENYVKLEMDALQVFGVRGYLMDSFIQQGLRDSLSSTIYAGTSEIMRNMIARFAGLPVESR